MTVTWSRNGVSEASDGDNAVNRPSLAGIQGSGLIPIGMYTNPRRRTGFAAATAVDVRAGNMASSNGNARVTPAPRRNVRRDKAIFLTIIETSSSGMAYFE